MREIERIQRLTARLFATHASGHNLLLIGGFRYRLLDRSARVSMDIDYHWEGDMDQKQEELLRVCSRLLLPQVRRELGYEGDARRLTGPEADSPNARFIELRFWTKDHALVLPLEITKILRSDPPSIRTADGIVYPTPTDTDLIESKLIAVVNQLYVQHRDFVDIFLFSSHLAPDSHSRLRLKLEQTTLSPEALKSRLDDLEQNADYHSRAVQKLIDTQVDAVVAEQLNRGGGASTVFGSALQIVKKFIAP
jgi:hypothetical protein